MPAIARHLSIKIKLFNSERYADMQCRNHPLGVLCVN